MNLKRKLDSYLTLLSKMKVQYLKIRHHRGKSSAIRIYHLHTLKYVGVGVGQWEVKERALADCPLKEHVVPY